MLLFVILIFECLMKISAFSNGKVINSTDINLTDIEFSLFAIVRLNKNEQIDFKKKWEYHCTATAITKNHLVTAAHCVVDYFIAKESYETFYLIPFKSRINVDVITNPIPINKSDIDFHSKFENVTCPEYDEAVITISDERLSTEIVPMRICLHEHLKLKAISLKQFRQKYYTQPVMMTYGEFQLNDSSVCRSESRPYILNNNSQLCLTSNTNSISEYGDSGSPLMTMINPCLMGILSCGTQKTVLWEIFYNLRYNDSLTSRYIKTYNITQTNTSITPDKPVNPESENFNLGWIIGFVMIVILVFILFICTYAVYSK